MRVQKRSFRAWTRSKNAIIGGTEASLICTGQTPTTMGNAESSNEITSSPATAQSYPSGDPQTRGFGGTLDGNLGGGPWPTRPS